MTDSSENGAKRTRCVVVDLPVSSHTRLIADWGVWMRGEGLAHRTISDRTDTILRFAADGLDVVAATAPMLIVVLATEGWKPSTRATYYRTLRAWHLWLVRHGIRPDNPTDLIKAPRVPRRRPRPCSTPELERLLAVCNRRRTRAMVVLAMCEGLRVQEIAAHRGEYLRGQQLRVIGKGGVDDDIPAHPLVLELAEHFPRRGLWFPSYQRPERPITASNVSRVISDAFRRAGVEATAHQIRHWFGTEALRSAGGNIRVVQELMRHASLASTQIYTRVDGDEKTAAVLGLPVPHAA